MEAGVLRVEAPESGPPDQINKRDGTAGRTRTDTPGGNGF
jgi:hypothetical protein